MAIHLGRSLPNASRDRPERRRGRPARRCRHCRRTPAAPTWSCSRWGLPCRSRCRQRGALLPHHFTLAARRFAISEPVGARRCVSVALSLGSPPPGVTRHRASVEPGLSSPCDMQRAAIRPSGDLLAGTYAEHRSPTFNPSNGTTTTCCVYRIRLAKI